ncbi:unnamed protein product [Rotaria sp. Silwood2]|nr:unnamed protein product [Rotaria sp. Silwood2]
MAEYLALLKAYEFKNDVFYGSIGLRLLSNQQFKIALPYANYIHQSENDWFSLAQMMIHMNAYDEAATCFRIISRQFERSTQYWVSLGDAYRKNQVNTLGSYDSIVLALLVYKEADLSWEEILQKAANESDAHIRLFLVHYVMQIHRQTSSKWKMNGESRLNQLHKRSVGLCCLHLAQLSASEWNTILQTLIDNSEYDGAAALLQTLSFQTIKYIGICANPVVRFFCEEANKIELPMIDRLKPIVEIPNINNILAIAALVHLQNFDYIWNVLKEQFLSEPKQYDKVLICHKVQVELNTAVSLEWIDQGIIENDSITFDLKDLTRCDWLELGRSHLKETNYDTALNCFFKGVRGSLDNCTAALEHILSLLPGLPDSISLWYAVAIFRNARDIFSVTCNSVQYISQIVDAKYQSNSQFIISALHHLNKIEQPMSSSLMNMNLRLLNDLSVSTKEFVGGLHLLEARSNSHSHLLAPLRQQYDKYMFTRDYGKVKEAMHMSVIELANCLQDVTSVDALTEFLKEYHGTRYLKKMAADHNYQQYFYNYYLLEGMWDKWIVNEDFESIRQKSIKSLLTSKQWEISDVELLLNDPLIPRTSEGWLHSQRKSLAISGRKRYTKVDGIKFNIITGKVTFLLVPARYPGHTALFGSNDIADVFMKGITKAIFTLDQPDNEFLSHPFQKMKYAPAGLMKTQYLATLLHTDYLLKFMTTGMEINSKWPFPMRETSEGFMKRLPKRLQGLLKPIEMRNKLFSRGNMHRFWIEAGDPIYECTISKETNEIIYRIGDVPMYVKQHLLRYDDEGTLVDDNSIGSEPDRSPEAQFAKAFTDNYEEIGAYFPEFLRLQELAKLGVLLTFMRHRYTSLNKDIAEDIDVQWICNDLCQIRLDLEYPLNTRNNIDHEYWEILQTDDQICAWVPAVFMNKNSSQSRVYGGVCLLPTVESGHVKPNYEACPLSADKEFSGDNMSKQSTRSHEQVPNGFSNKCGGNKRHGNSASSSSASNNRNFFDNTSTGSSNFSSATNNGNSHQCSNAGNPSDHFRFTNTISDSTINHNDSIDNDNHSASDHNDGTDDSYSMNDYNSSNSNNDDDWNKREQEIEEQQRWITVFLVSNFSYSYDSDLNNEDTHTFDNSVDCLNYLSSIGNEQVLVVVADEYADDQLTLKKLQGSLSVSVIYRKLGGQDQRPLFIDRELKDICPKIQCSFTDESPFLSPFSKSSNEIFNVFSPNNKEISTRNLNEESTTFVWYQIMMELIFSFLLTPEAKSEFFAECRRLCINNFHQLSEIDQLEKNYEAKKALKYYSKITWYYKLINQALRCQNVSSIYHFRMAIIHIHEQLKTMRNEDTKIITLYRGQKIGNEEIEKLRRNINGLISFNSFLSTSSDKEVAHMFGSCEGNEETNGQTSVVFEMKTACNLFSNISEVAEHPDEQEYLFLVGTTFKIVSVKKIERDRKNYWYVQLIDTTDDDLNDLKAIKQQLLERLAISKGPFKLTWGRFLYNVGEYDTAANHYEKWLKDLENIDDNELLATIHNDLGAIYYHKKAYAKSNEHHSSAFAQAQTAPFPLCHSVFYDNQGGTRMKLNEYAKAFDDFRRALGIEQRRRPINELNIGRILSNMGTICYHRRQYRMALRYFQQAFERQRRISLVKSDELAVTCNNLGNTYIKLKEFIQAEKFYSEAYKIARRLLPEGHEKVKSFENNWNESLKRLENMNANTNKKVPVKVLNPTERRNSNISISQIEIVT